MRIKMHAWFVLSAFILIFHVGCERSSTPAEPEEQDKKALFIIMDGISADILESTDTPNIDRIIEQGHYSHAWLGGEADGYSESPTVSAVGYNHVLTGVWSNKHNVYNNDIEAPNYHYWNIFRLFKGTWPDKPVAIYSSWLDNRTKLAGDGLPEAGGISIDIHYDGFDTDTLAFPHEYGYVQRIDDHVSAQAAESIRKDAPYLSWIYLWYTDDTGHRYGETDEHVESIKTADEYVGRIWDAVNYRTEQHDEDWLVVITTDHGRSLPDGKGHGGQSERERTAWMVTNKKDVNSYFEHSKPAIVDIYPTIGRHLELDVPKNLFMELDGVPFRGEISISDPDASLNKTTQTIDISWTVWDAAGTVNIWLATTNNFREGGNDHYSLLEEVPVSDGQASVRLQEQPSDFYKIVLEAPHNTVNRWIVD